VPAAVVAALASVTAFHAQAAAERGRERLLAGDAAGAETSLAAARRWPAAAARAEAGLALARALRGERPVGVSHPSELLAFEPIALLEAALDRGDLGAGVTLADLARQAGHPLAPLYGAAIALERGDEATARRLLATSPVPTVARGLGRRLEEALARRDAGAAVLVRDRRGELVGTVDPEGRFSIADGLDPLLVPSLSAWLAAPPPRAEAFASGFRLTLDLDLARLAFDALGRRRGTIVLVEPRTGALLAAVSDPVTATTEGPAAFTQRREPASVAKILTAAAAYRSGIDADAQIRGTTCNGVARYGGKLLWCAWPAGPLSGLDHALALSCNVAFANLALQIGRERLVAEYRRWGFDAAPETLMGAAGRIRTLPRNDYELAELAVGLDVIEITPLHTALLAAAVGSDGTMPEPRIVAGGCGLLGLTDRPRPLPPPRPVLEPALAARLRRAMEAAAAYGTGAGLAPPSLPVAMKTGTASEPGQGYHVNYIGLAPAEDAAIAFGVRITTERTSPAVMRAAHEVTACLLAGLADRRATLERAARRQRALAAAASGLAHGHDHEVGGQLPGPLVQRR
jgi:peptidoglycan glycosyltransferase